MKLQSLTLPSLGGLASVLVVSACADLPGPPPDGDPTHEMVPAALAPAQTPPDPSDRSLFFGAARTLARGVTGAEDLLFSSDERLFVSATDGIYQLTRDPSGQVRATNLHPGESCSFTGIVQVAGVLYVACAGYSDSYLFGASIADPSAVPVFRKIYTMSGVAVANEIAADPQGRLYVAETLQGKILRLAISPTDPYALSGQQDWLATPSGITPNGLKYVDSSIYWTESLGGSVNRVLIQPDGRAGAITSFTDFNGGFLDDLYVNADGSILCASYFGGSLRAYTPMPLGLLYAQTFPGTFSSPADVLPAKGRFGLGANDLLVTDKSANTVVVLDLPF
jgi:sugar lactone lactonase YvrE